MKLTELDPKWLTLDGRRIGFVFRSPTSKDGEDWQTCFAENVSSGDQRRILDAQCPEIERHHLQLCSPQFSWRITGISGGIALADFDTLTVTPSLDGSKGGNWHGFITNGEIVGGI